MQISMDSAVKLIVGYERYQCHDKNFLASSLQGHDVGPLRLGTSSKPIALNYREALDRGTTI